MSFSLEYLKLASCRNKEGDVQQPKIGGEVRPHQDSTFLRTSPPSVVGLWWALEDSTKQNGCLWALPGACTPGVTRQFIRRCKLQISSKCGHTADGTLVTSEHRTCQGGIARLAQMVVCIVRQGSHLCTQDEDSYGREHSKLDAVHAGRMTQ